METIINEEIYDHNLTLFENLLGQLLLNQIIKQAEQHMKDSGCENLLQYITALLLEYYLKTHHQECLKSSYNYKTRRNGNRKRKVYSSEN